MKTTLKASVTFVLFLSAVSYASEESLIATFITAGTPQGRLINLPNGRRVCLTMGVEEKASREIIFLRPQEDGELKGKWETPISVTINGSKIVGRGVASFSKKVNGSLIARVLITNDQKNPLVESVINLNSIENFPEDWGAIAYPERTACPPSLELKVIALKPRT